MGNRLNDAFGPPPGEHVSFADLCLEVRSAVVQCLTEPDSDVKLHKYPEFTQSAFDAQLRHDVQRALDQVGTRGVESPMEPMEPAWGVSMLVTESISDKLRAYANEAFPHPEEYIARVHGSVGRMLADPALRLRNAQSVALREAIKAGDWDAIVAQETKIGAVAQLIAHATLEALEFGVSFVALRNDADAALHHPDFFPERGYEIYGGWHRSAGERDDIFASEAQIDIDRMASENAFFRRNSAEFFRREEEIESRFGPANAYLENARYAVQPLMFGRSNFGAIVHIWEGYGKTRAKLNGPNKTALRTLAAVGAQRIGDITSLRLELEKR